MRHRVGQICCDQVDSKHATTKWEPLMPIRIGLITSLIFLNALGLPSLAQETESPSQPSESVHLSSVQLKFDSGWPSIGRPEARVILLEFTDYECPYCKKFHDATLPALKQKYVSTG